jgi:hypothetical protein
VITKQKEEFQQEASASPARTVVGWQGIRCVLPPDWNVAGFSMDRDNGYLRVDAPGNSALTVQIKWMNAAKPAQGQGTLYHVLAPHARRLLRRPEPPVPKPDLRENLEKMLKETAKQAKKAKSAFDSSLKPEKTEGEHGERTAINFSWSGGGRGQGKIWYCETCRRVVIAQVVGMAKDQHAITAIASQLFASLHDHAEDGYERWALYDLQADIPADFRLEAQKLLSGYLQLVFSRGAERIVLDRWGLANMTKKKFTLDEWFRNYALVGLKRLTRTEMETARGHSVIRYAGRLSLPGRLKALREAKLSLRRFPSRYKGGIWECEESNKIYAVQVFCQARSEELWAEVVSRCACH